ncbi:MAG: DUF4446 family protein [Minisyncoccia bacterium]
MEMSFDLLTIIYITLVILVVLVGWIIRLEIKLGRLLLGKNAKTLEDSIFFAKDNLEKLNNFEKKTLENFSQMEKKLKRSVQAVETIRFNPFKGNGDGGSQSFSTSFLSEDGNGVVISSLYSRDRVSIFSKPLQKFESSFELTGEEKEVVENSKKVLVN